MLIWQTNAVLDFASGEYAQGYGPQRKLIASQRRDVDILKPNIFVVADRVCPEATPSSIDFRPVGSF